MQKYNRNKIILLILKIFTKIFTTVEIIIKCYKIIKEHNRSILLLNKTCQIVYFN